MTDGRAHSRFGGSKADRWMACPGSVALCDTMPAQTSSPYAAEGSAAHALAEACLKDDLHPRHFEGSPLPGYPDHVVTGEMCDAVVTYLNVVTHELAQSPDAELYVEQRFTLDISTAEPGEVFGSNDALIYTPSSQRLWVADYKHGVGVSVSAEDNAQLKFYAAGALFAHPEWKVREVVLVIVQPRARDAEENGAVREFVLPVADLIEFISEVEDAVEAAKLKDTTPEGRYRTGKWCRWCEAASVCPAKEMELLNAATLDFASVTEVKPDLLPDPKTLDVERLSKILAAGDILSAWISQVYEQVEALLLSGQAVPGWKVVEKVARAKWIGADEEVAAHVEMVFGLGEDDVRPRKLVTITELERQLKAAGASKAALDDLRLKYTTKESSGLTVARSSDKREAADAVTSAFGEVKL